MEQDQTNRDASVNKSKKNGNKRARSPLEEIKVPTQVKLAGLWATVMFMYIYVDIIGFYQQGVIEDILQGKVWIFDITQTWLLSGVMLMTIPALMVYLSLALPARMNRYANIGLGAFHIILAFGSSMGEINAYYIFGSAVEVVLLSQVVMIAWKWPRVSADDLDNSKTSNGVGSEI